MICPYNSECTTNDIQNLVCKCPNGFSGEICRRETSFHIVKEKLLKQKIDESPDPAISGFYLPKYFRISFDLLLEEQKLKTTRRQILLLESNLPCDWSQLLIQKSDDTMIKHIFGCINDDNDEEYTYKDESDLSINSWHKIEYTQIPIWNSTLAELTIKVNKTVLHKVVNKNPKEYDDVKIYYGYKSGEKGLGESVPEGMIKNFKIEEYIPGLGYMFEDFII